MATEYVTTGVIRKGKLMIRRSEVFLSQLARMNDGEVIVIVQRRQATRSTDANRFYWGALVQAVADHTGYSPNDVHEIFKAKFLPKRLAMTDGNGEIVGDFVIGGTTTTLDVGQFLEYCRAIELWASEVLGVVFENAA